LNKKYCFLFLVIVAMAFVSGCFLKKSGAEKRSDNALYSKGVVNIGVAWPVSSADDGFVEGVTLARDEINQAGGILGRKLNLVIKDTADSALKELRAVHDFAEDPEILAVIGFRDSPVSIQAASLLQKSGILSIFTGVTSFSLTQKKHDLVFRNTGHDIKMGNRLAEYAVSRKYKKMVMLYTYDNHGKSLANAFENRCDDYEINIVDRRGYFADNDKFFDNILGTWQNLDFDAICLIGELPHIGTFITRLKEYGIKKPLLASDGLASFDLKEHAGDSAEGMVLITPFHISDRNKATAEFARNMKKKFNVDRFSQFSASGYDALKFLAYAMEQAKSVSADKVADKIHSGISWEGATGIQKFDGEGEIINKEYDIITFKNGSFEYLEH